MPSLPAPFRRSALGLVIALGVLELIALGTEPARQAWATYRAQAPYRALGAEGPAKVLAAAELQRGEGADFFCAPSPHLILTVEGHGWGGPFRLLMRFDGPSTLGPERVLEHQETPRYGGKILGPRATAMGWPLPEAVDGVSGATVTADALDALRARGAALAQSLWPNALACGGKP